MNKAAIALVIFTVIVIIDWNSSSVEAIRNRGIRTRGIFTRGRSSRPKLYDHPKPECDSWCATTARKTSQSQKDGVCSDCCGTSMVSGKCSRKKCICKSYNKIMRQE